MAIVQKTDALQADPLHLLIMSPRVATRRVLSGRVEKMQGWNFVCVWKQDIIMALEESVAAPFAVLCAGVYLLLL